MPTHHPNGEYQRVFTFEPSWESGSGAMERAKNQLADPERIIIRNEEHGTGYNRFAAFPCWEAYWSWFDRQPDDTHKHCYEIFEPDKPVLEGYDIDYERKENDPTTPLELFEKWYMNRKKFLDAYGFQTGVKGQLRVLDASNARKISLHIVNPFRAFKKMSDMKKWYKLKQDWFKINCPEIPVDFCVARNNGGMRMVESSKLRDPSRVLKQATWLHAEKKPRNDFLWTVIPSKAKFEDMARGDLYEEVQTSESQADYKLPNLENTDLSNIHRTIVQYLKENRIEEFEVGKEPNLKGFLSLKRKCPGKCILRPNHIHDHRDAWVRVDEEKRVYIGCFCTSGGQYIGGGTPKTKPTKRYRKSEPFEFNEYVDEKHLPAYMTRTSKGVIALNCYTTLLEKGEIICIRSNMGTGKTFAFKKFLREHPNAKVMIVTFRRTLADKYLEDFADEFKFKSYLDRDETQISGDRIIVQVDSLDKVRGKFDVLFLDEIEYTNSHRMSFPKNMGRIEDQMNYYIQNTPKVIAADAQLQNQTVRWLRSFDRPTFVVENGYKRYKGRKCFLYYLTQKTNHVQTYINSVLKEAKDGRTIYCPVGIKSSVAENLYAQLQAENISVLLMTADTEKISPSLWDQYQVIIYTPTIVAGLSFEKKYFDLCMAYFPSDCCNADQASQMIHRVRECDQYHVYIRQKKCNLEYHPIEDEELDREILEKWQYNSRFPFVIDPGENTVEHNPYYYLFRHHLKRDNLSRHFYLNVFRENMELHGLDCTRIYLGDKRQDSPSEQQTEAVEEYRSLLVQELLNAPQISTEDARKLENKRDLTREEFCSLKKHRIRECYQVPKVTEQILMSELAEPEIQKKFGALKRVLQFRDLEETMRWLKNELQNQSQFSDGNQKLHIKDYKSKLGWIVYLLREMGFKKLGDECHLEDCEAKLRKILEVPENVEGIRKVFKFSKPTKPKPVKDWSRGTLFKFLNTCLNRIFLSLIRCGKGMKKRRLVIDSEMIENLTLCEVSIPTHKNFEYVSVEDLVQPSILSTLIHNGPPM